MINLPPKTKKKTIRKTKVKKVKVKRSKSKESEGEEGEELSCSLCEYKTSGPCRLRNLR